MRWVSPWCVALTATFVVAGCGGETIDRTSVGHSPPTTVGRDAGSDGSVVPPDPDQFLRPMSGVRLTVIEPYSPDNPLLWDQQKDIQCRPQLATDGTIRCLPDVGYSVIFLDSRCTHPVTPPGPDPCGGSPKYYTDTDGAGPCATRKTTVFTAGTRIDTPQELYPHNADPCSLLDRTMPPQAPGDYHEAVPSDPSEFVAFTEEVFPVTDALAVVVWVGADGSRLPHGLELLPSKTRCEQYPPPQEPAAPHSWCIPTARARPSDGFPTDQCSGEHLAGACEPTDVIELSPTGQDIDLLETGALTSTVYFANPNEGGKCMTFPPSYTSAPNYSHFYRSGSRLQIDKYPTLAVTRQGTDRVQVAYLTSGEQNLRVESYFDTKYGQQCTPIEFSSGGTWCVSSTLGFTPGIAYNVYADPACTRPLASADPSQSNPFQVALVYPSGHTCTSWGFPTLHSLAEYRGPTYQTFEGPCRPSDSIQVPPGQLYLEPGPQIDPASVFAAVPQ